MIHPGKTNRFMAGRGKKALPLSLQMSTEQIAGLTNSWRIYSRLLLTPALMVEESAVYCSGSCGTRTGDQTRIWVMDLMISDRTRLHVPFNEISSTAYGSNLSNQEIKPFQRHMNRHTNEYSTPRAQLGSLPGWKKVRACSIGLQGRLGQANPHW